MKLKGLLKVALVLLAISTMFVACDTLAGGKFPPIFTPFTPEAGTVYVQMPETWLGNKAYGAWIWADGGAGSWYDLEVVDESEGIFSCDVPADKQNIIFVAFTSETKDWANKKEQTADLKVPTDENVLYVIQSSSWVDPTGKAEIPEPPAEPKEPTPADLTSLAGTMNDWNPAGDINEKFYAKGGDQFAITNGTWDYKFCGATITALDTEVELVKGHKDNVTFAEGVLTKYEWYKIVLRVDGDKVFVKVVATGDDPYVPPADCGLVYTPEAGKVYVISSDWNKDGAVIAAYLWDSNNNNVWKKMTAVEGVAGLLEVDATGYENVIFRRFGPDQEIGWGDSDWGGKTGDLVLPTDNKVVAKISGWSGDNSVTVEWLPFATK